MLHLHAADRIEPLARRLAEVYAAPPDDALAPDWVAVPSAGMERWLSLELARYLGAAGGGSGDGVTANIDFHFPDSLRQSVLAAGRDPTTPDPWQVERLTWTVLQSAEERRDGLPRALGDPQPGVPRFGTARRIADLFDRYHVHRPAMIRHWAAGHLVDGTGRDLPPHNQWQPRLWRLCRAFIGEPSPPERLPDLLEAVRSGSLDLDLPGRVALFGLTLLPGGASFLDLAAAVASARDVHVFLLEPSTAVRGRLAALPEQPVSGARLRAEDRSDEMVHHPLLRSWGRLHRETAVLLVEASRRSLPQPEHVTGSRDGVGSGDSPDRGPSRPSLLAEIQADIRADRAPSGALRPDPSDRSVQLHACSGPTRQVEVARDVILHLLADPELDLSEDDIVVVTPSLDRFAPLIEGIFGSSAGPIPAHGVPVPGEPTGQEPTREPSQAAQPPALRYQIADRSIRTTNPVLDAMTDLMALLGGRFDAASVLDFIGSAPVRRRFDLTSDDVARIHDWVHATGIRWGLDAHHRRNFGLPASVDTNTWEAGLDRLVVGTAMHDDGLHLAVGGVAPYEAGSDDAALAGRLTELITALARLQRETDVVRPVDAWMALLRSTIPDLFETAPDLRWQLDALSRVLRTVTESATTSGLSAPTLISFADVRRILDVELRAGPGRPNFFRGGVTVTSMTPLRGVPFRVVCLLGTDHEALTTATADGDDLTATGPLLGDRDLRGDIRLALLEAVLAAGDRLIVIRDGRDVRTNRDIPPPVVVEELTDTLGAMVDPELRPAILEALETTHPRQAHDERCFEPGVVVDGPWSFDPGGRAGALARRARVETGPSVFLSAPLERPAAPLISLDQLRKFFQKPVGCFLEERLGLRLPRVEQAPRPVVPLALEQLPAYEAGRRLLDVLQEGRSWQEWARVEVRLGTVPPGVLAPVALEEVRTTAEEIFRAAVSHGLRTGSRGAVPVDVTLADGTRIVGTVGDRLRLPAGGPCDVGFARYKPVDRVHAWLDLMALVATDPSRPWRSVAVRRAESKQKKAVSPVIVDLSPAAAPDDERRAETARQALGVAVDLYRRGLAEPIPLFPTFSYAVALGDHPRSAWRPYAWRPYGGRGDGGRGDGHDPSDRLVFGECSYADMMAIEPVEGDPEGPGNRVGRFAHYLWDAVDRSTTPSPDPGAGGDSGGATEGGTGNDTGEAGG